jgi:hypothetical protein
MASTSIPRIHTWESQQQNKPSASEHRLPPDPVSLGILAEDEVSTNLQRLYDEPDVLNYLLDPTLHTVSYLRDASPFLLSTLMAVSSSLSCDQRRLRLQGLAMMHACYSFQTQEKSMEALQAFLCLTHCSFAVNQAWSQNYASFQLHHEQRKRVLLEYVRS